MVNQINVGVRKYYLIYATIIIIHHMVEESSNLEQYRIWLENIKFKPDLDKMIARMH